MSSQQFCLKWNNHTNNMMTVFQSLLSTEALVDVTLACDGLSLKAHKIVLSACSPFFQSLFLENPCKHPIVIMKDTTYKDLKDVIDFMYKGEVNVAQDRLPALLKTAETLKIKGLAEVSSENRQSPGIVSKDAMAPQSTSASHSQQQLPVGRSQSPPGHGKRKRGRFRKRSLSDSNRSEDDIVPSKIKEQPGSPEIEELSGDASLEASDSRQQGSNLPQSRVHHRSTVNFSSRSHRQSLSSHQATPIEESPSGDDTEFEVEPSKLLEQSLTTPSVPATSSTPTSMSLNFPTSGGTEISHMGNSQALVPVSSASDSGFSHMQDPDSPQDIKPAILTFDEPTSSAAGPSHQSDSSMMYIDQSSMPGPSDFQDQSIVQHDSQAQGNLEPNSNSLGFMALSFQYQENLEKGASLGRRFKCSFCSYSSCQKGNVVRHLRVHTGERPYECSFCKRKFSLKAQLKTHFRIHTGEKPYNCTFCFQSFNQLSHLKKHVFRLHEH